MIITIIVLIIAAAIIGGGIWLGVYLHDYYKKAKEVVNDVGNVANDVGNVANNIGNRINNVGNITEGFMSELSQDEQDARQDQEDALLGRSPESSYKFRNYYLQREPVEAQIVKHEVSHEFPSGVLHSDMTMSTNNRIRFSDDADGPNNFHFGVSDDKNKLHLFMKDRPGSRDHNRFVIRGKGCTQGNCNTNATDLHVFSDEPHYAIKKIGGGDVHRFGSNGDAQHTGTLKIGDRHILDGRTGNQYSRGVLNSNMVNVRDKLFFSSTPHNVDPSAVSSRGPHHDSDPFWIEKIRHSANKNSLRMVINDDENDRFQVYGGRHHFGKGIEQPLMQVTGKGNLWTRNTTNTKDLNVRGRIYFSQAGKVNDDDDYINDINDIINPQDENFNPNRWTDIHDSDPYWIEKVHTSGNHNALRITINDDGASTAGNSNEAIEIYSGSHNAGNKTGTLLFKIDASGRVDIKGPNPQLYVGSKKIA